MRGRGTAWICWSAAVVLAAVGTLGAGVAMMRREQISLKDLAGGPLRVVETRAEGLVIDRPEGGGLFVLNPARRHSQPLRLALVSWEEIGEGLEILLVGGDGKMRARPTEKIGGPPHALLYDVEPESLPADPIEVTVWRGSIRVDGLRVTARRRPPRRMADFDEVWPTRRAWTESVELLYSTWIARLFALPKKKPGGWRPLHQVTRDPERNFLYGSLGLNEDDYREGGLPGVSLWGDCADVPYMLRAYFAWKMGLPMRLSECSRGNGKEGPSCYAVRTNLMTDYQGLSDRVARFNSFARREIAWVVHSGTTRTLPYDRRSDLYPIAITPRTLIPGVVYVDSGGHVLVVSDVDGKRITAIDGHPNKSITIRRFSERRYFPVYLTLRTGGFKAFRPIIQSNRNIVTIPNRDLGKRFSIAQYGFGRRSSYYSFVERSLEGSDERGRSPEDLQPLSEALVRLVTWSEG